MFKLRRMRLWLHLLILEIPKLDIQISYRTIMEELKVELKQFRSLEQRDLINQASTSTRQVVNYQQE